MEDSYETFEEELGPPRAEPPPRKSVRQIHIPVSAAALMSNRLRRDNEDEMYDARKFRQEMAPVPQQLRIEPRILQRVLNPTATASLHKHLPFQNPNEVETPWENVTLNRCLFVAITILVLTSGFQRVAESLRGQRTTEGKEELRVRRPGTLLHRRQPLVYEKTLWEVMFWWLPDLDEEEDEDGDDDAEVTKGKLKRGATSQSRGLRNKPLPDKNLLKQREGKLKDRREKKYRNKQIKDKNEREKTEEPNNTAYDEEEGEGN